MEQALLFAYVEGSESELNRTEISFCDSDNVESSYLPIVEVEHVQDIPVIGKFIYTIFNMVALVDSGCCVVT